MAVIISFLSEYRSSPAKDYTLPGEIKIKGQYTNDVPLCYLISKLKAEHPEENIKLLLITSFSVYTDKCFSADFTESRLKNDTRTFEKTMYEYYLHALTQAKQLNSVDLPDGIEICCIPYDFIQMPDGTPVKIDVADNINNIYLNARNSIENEEHVYVDYTGGLRDISYLMVSLVQYFELANIKCETVVYSNFNTDRLYDIKYIYNIGQLIQAVSDFTETGSVNKLSEFFEAYLSKEENKDIYNIISSLDSFVKAISIGQVDRLDGIREDIKTSLDAVENNADGKSENLYSSIFMTLIPQIRKSLHMESGNSLNYPDIIRWCLDHRFIQQAVTIYVEKLPLIYINGGIGELNLPKATNISSGTAEATMFYTTFWDELNVPYDCRSNEFANKLSKKFENRDKIATLQILAGYTHTCSPFNDEEMRAIKKLHSYITRYQCNPENKRYGSLESQKSADRRLNQLFADIKKTAYCLLYDKNDVAADTVSALEQAPSDGKDKSFRNKLKALEKVKAFNTSNNEKYAPLCIAMTYYLALKLIRNHMNHAAHMSENDCTTLQSLTGEDEPFTYDAVIRIIRCGIDITDKNAVLIDPDGFQKIKSYTM